MADFPFFDLRIKTAPFSEYTLGPPGSSPFWGLAIDLPNNGGAGPYSTAELKARLISIDVNVTPEGGLGAVVRFTGNMGGVEGLDLRIHAGIEQDNDLIFKGRIGGVQDVAWGISSIVNAYGTSYIRGRQRANKGLDFSNLTLRQCMFYIDKEAEEYGEFGMFGGEDYIIRDPNASDNTEAETQQPGFGVFGSEATWAEVEQTLLQDSGYVAYDNPYGRVIHRKPEIRANADPVNYAFWWTPPIAIDRYDQGGFTFNGSEREIYNRVIVFARTQDYGEYITEPQGPGEPLRVREFYQVYAEAAVNRVGLYNAAPNTDDVYPDWQGDQATAEREVARLAAEHSVAKGAFEYTGPFRTWWANDVVYIEQIEARPSPRRAFISGVPLDVGDSAFVRAQYTCLVDGDIAQRIARNVFNASISGQAALRDLQPAPPPGGGGDQYRSASVGEAAVVGQSGGGGATAEGAPFPAMPYPGRLHIEGGVPYFDWKVAPTQFGMTPQDAINLLSATFADPMGWSRAGVVFRYNPGAAVAEYEWMVESECAALIGAGGGGCTLCGATCRVTFFANATDMGTINHETGHAMLAGHPAFPNGSIMWGGGNGTPYPSDADIAYFRAWLGL